MEILNKAYEDISYLIGWASGETNKQYDFEGTKGPIIGIHGSFGGWTKDSLKKYMSSGVRGSLLYLGILNDKFDKYLPTINEAVVKYNNPLIVGFSSGGLLALLYVSRYNAWNNIQKIITVGTPFDGIPNYLSILGQGLESISPTGSLIAEIRSIRPPKNKVLSIFGNNDEFTPNPQSISLNWPTAIIDSPTHGDIQNHSERIENVLNAELFEGFNPR